ncbi:PucR family transcriptional regulator [Mycolicibacterium brisbanense]
MNDRAVPALIGEPAGDLFTFADAISALVDAPITIEDGSSRVLAFSGRQDETDQPRVTTVLNRQVPASYRQFLEEAGIFEHLLRCDEPVWVPADAPEMKLGRVAVAVRAGDEYLGSLWAAVAEPLPPERHRALCESAKLVALQVLRHRADADAQRRVRADLVATVLSGADGAGDATARLGLGSGSLAVLALGLRRPTESECGTDLGRLTDALAMHLGAVHPRSAVALVNGVGYAVLAVNVCRDRLDARDCKPDPETGLRRIAEDFLDRIGRRADAVIGIGRVIAPPVPITRSRQDAERTLRVLRSGRAPDRVALFRDIHVDSLLLQLAADAAADGLDPLDSIRPVAEQAEYFVETLEAWLDAFGDVPKASAAVHVHPNTFRYRLRRVRELVGTDLDDPEARFRLMVQLRLSRLIDRR